jgi:hypothetical protein
VSLTTAHRFPFEPTLVDIGPIRLNHTGKGVKERTPKKEIGRVSLLERLVGARGLCFVASPASLDSLQVDLLSETGGIFAYAPNINHRQIEARVQRTQLRWMVARLADYALQFNKRSGRENWGILLFAFGMKFISGR